MRGGRGRKGFLTETGGDTVTQEGEPAAAAVDKPAEIEAGALEKKEVEIPYALYERFEDFRFVGRGGMGAVYRARDFRLHRDVAIKILFGADGGLLREARSQARLTHENACKLYEAGSVDHAGFLVMQYIDGETLSAAKARMTLEEKVRVVRQIASALHEAHRLGLVHRDVKPSNIMVEIGEDGGYKPYLMDFGIAREVGDSGATVTGTPVGTPAFMAPEQAAGKVRSLDRRTDVYCLGATLYDLLAGRPPFSGDSVIDTLHRVVNEEPAPIRKVDKNIPKDIEAIIATCLEKEPDARYESAKALGEDLQRFLDGDPVKARRASFAYVLLRRARRHKAAVALAGAALLTITVASGLWIRDRRLAAQQATLARELGEDVKEMELFLRSAHGMPLHDVERERDIVRARLTQVTERMNAAGDVGRGPGHYALGRGYLALQDAPSALSHLEEAALAGYGSPGLDYAMGVALTELYKRALEDTKRIESAEKRKARVAEIEAKYKTPALARLKAALAGSLDVPAYAEGLIALYEDRHEEALEKAQEASSRAPWLYEAKKLEGDVLFAIGSRYRADAAFDYDKMMDWFRRAADAYRIASDLGRSDPTVHEAECELHTQIMNAESERGASMRLSFERAKSACQRAISASSRGSAGQLKLAQAHNSFAWSVVTGQHPGEEPEEAMREAVRHAEEAAQKSPDSAMARYLLGAVWRTRLIYTSDRGLNALPAAERSIAGYEEALRLDPGFLWALNEVCSSLIERGLQESFRGTDPLPSLDKAMERCDRAIALEPGFMFPRFGKMSASITAADYLIATGRSPEALVRSVLDAIDAIKKENPAWSWGPYWRREAVSREAIYALESGGDPAPSLASAEASVRELEQAMPTSLTAHAARAEVEAIKARWLLARGEDPTPSLVRSIDAYKQALDAEPLALNLRVGSAAVELTRIRWAMKGGRATPADFSAASAKLLPLLDRERVDPRLYQTMAEIHELYAASLGERDAGAAAAEIEKGLSAAEKALSRNPRMASALAGKARLLLLRAKQTRAPEEGRAAAGEALSALSLAVRENPLLTRTEARALAEAAQLSGEESARGGTH